MSDDISASTVEFDMFGDPMLPIKDRRGRPSYAKSKENQELVALLRAAGWTQGRIARYIGCDEKTLRKNFSRELEQGLDIIEGMALEVTLKKLKSGNSVAISRIFDVIDKRGNPAVPVATAPEPEERLGKKQTADRDAKTAHEGTEWGSLLQ
ncbi:MULTISPECIES: helix-turn-helix domain-containing protein [unclassified Rhizobium]|uniref:helix-turn-helix domain-containing protein n=1 Tax=unclassified Rhizobium TaxID=2613769 RepID=UPI001ADB5F92|nr:MULTISPECIES: helix-turn-helix domain-containing protein [unclassified Rhizobium]MBO9099989.1 helix-turn-helix domain-containing protein [Rhizobium sp. L58/93]QXZ82800.1 helix-turn-helix domain-containing protein [Rhizobium sp. K1/93]QXZ89687.1 helix-turn-helix domain-containing protein [Rhizobium sp. K15/93]